jgi:hypothetical protein
MFRLITLTLGVFIKVLVKRSVDLTLFHFAKAICSLAAREHARSCRLLTVLHQLCTEMMVPPAEPEQADGDVQDIRNALARARGRSKTGEIPNATVRAAKATKAVGMMISCESCDGSHDLSSCPYQNLVLGARIANADVIPGSEKMRYLLWLWSSKADMSLPSAIAGTTG